MSNQLWETIAFIAKAAFMIGLTPWMIRLWGAKGYGEFALSSSTFILLSLVDFGIRARTRVMLCAERDRAQWPTIIWRGAFTFATIGVATVAISFSLTASGILSAVFSLASASRYLLFMTTAMSMLVMLSGLLLEPLIAAGRIGQAKWATALGWLTSIPIVATVLMFKGGVIAAIAAWLGSLLVANLSSLWRNRDLFPRGVTLSGDCIGFNKFIETLRGAFWINISGVTWITKTYGITLLIAALNGPAAAGFFFILLRLSEVISALGAISADVLLAELAHSSTTEKRRHSFLSSYSLSVVFCSHIGLLIAFFARDFFNLWLPSAPPMSIFVGLVIGMLGFASAFNRTATNAAIGLDLAKTAATWGIVEAISFVTAVVLGSFVVGLLAQLSFALVATLALIPIARAISKTLEASPSDIWLDRWRDVAPFVAISAAILFVGNLASTPTAKLLSVAICAAIALANLSSWLRRIRGSSQTLLGQAISSPC